MEKFLLLVRRYLGATLLVMQRGGWSEEVVEEGLGSLREVPFNVEDMKVPNGLRFHCIDIWVDELERVGVLGESDEEKEGEVDEELAESLLTPLRELKKGSPTKAVRVKAGEALKDERLPGVEKKVPVVEDGWGGCED